MFDSYLLLFDSRDYEGDLVKKTQSLRDHLLDRVTISPRNHDSYHLILISDLLLAFVWTKFHSVTAPTAQDMITRTGSNLPVPPFLSNMMGLKIGMTCLTIYTMQTLLPPSQEISKLTTLQSSLSTHHPHPPPVYIWYDLDIILTHYIYVYLHPSVTHMIEINHYKNPYQKIWD